ncbi:hypothetical protein V6N11_069560 [Hibiscus sabdariffa]|uniref:Uncharacterized protein n=1 Tax=Hibiscus sabdariffa TaxID=183260 RepID=A0ABR2Q361_9ROSI
MVPRRSCFWFSNQVGSGQTKFIIDQTNSVQREATMVVGINFRRKMFKSLPRLETSENHHIWTGTPKLTSMKLFRVLHNGSHEFSVSGGKGFARKER